MNFVNLPKTREGQQFEKMFMTAFKPMQDYIKFNNLEDDFTDNDAALFAHALAEGMLNWCEFLKQAKAQGNGRRGD